MMWATALLFALAFARSSACPTGCECTGEGQQMKCHLPWARELPAWFLSKFGQVKKLDLSDNNIMNIPSGSLSLLPHLEELVLSGNKIYFLETGAFKGAPQLRKICLEDNNIHFIDDEAFRDLKNLEELTLTRNKITEIPDLSENKNLKSLCLAQNLIEEVEDDAFRDNPQLEKLSLKRNRLATLSREAFSTNLTSFTSINLVGNSLRDVPDVVKDMENLESLSLCFNPIKTFETDDFAKLGSLKNLSMTSVGLSDFPENVFPQSLERLWVGGNKITGATLEKMNFPRLVELDLSDNDIGNLLPGAFTGVPNVVELNLSGSEISSNSENSFSSLTELECLNLSDNQFEYVPSLMLNKKLKKLNLNGNKIRLMQNILAEARSNLVELRMSGNGFDRFPSSVNMPSLELLDLSHNQLTDSLDDLPRSLKILNISHNAFESLESKDFSEFPLLETLNLRSNNLTSLPRFTNATNLRELLVCHNKIQDLSPGNMSSMPQLEVLSADENLIEEITDDTFRNNTALKRISLNNNGMKTVSSSAFAEQPNLEELWLLFNNLKRSPNIQHNRKLRVIGLCNNPIGNLPKRALVGPEGLEVVLLRSMGLSELSADVFGPTHRIKVLNLALENTLTSIPTAIRNMPELRVLKLSGNPIKDPSYSELAGHNNLRELRLDDMKLENFDVTSLFPRLPALRSLYLSGNPWRCDCDTKWYALGIDGARARVETEDRDHIVCASPERLEGKRIDFLRLGDFQQCTPGKADKVKTTSAVISLPFIGAFARDYEGAFHLVSYVPVGGGSVKEQRVGKLSTEAQLHGLTPGTEYFVCTSIMTVTSKVNASHAHQERENCFKIETHRREDGPEEEGKADTNSFGATSERDLAIVYAVLGGVIGLGLIGTAIAFAVWCRRSRTQLREHFANLSEISDGAAHDRSNGEFGAQSTPQAKEGTNGRQMRMQGLGHGAHVNEACDVMNEGRKSARTKL